MVMKRKNLYALALLLFLSTVALSNESARFRCGTAGTTCTDPKSGSPATPTTTAKCPATTPTPAPTVAESHALLHTFIKLLYI
jgi:hypothetical protein